MNAAVIGTGRTGSEVMKLLGSEGSAFNTMRRPTVKEIRRHSVAIVFVPGEVMPSLLPILLEAAIPSVIGSTGWSTEGLHEDLRQRDLGWIVGRNFAPAMALLRPMIRWMAKAHELWEKPSYEIEETHHLHKQDLPSGTALAWREWLGREVSVHSIREGEVIGRHRLSVRGPHEELILSHEVRDRSLFAKGAIAAGNQILAHPEWRGLIPFENILEHERQPNTEPMENPHEP